MNIRPIAGALGAEIHGIDLARPLGADALAAIRGALLEHLVIFFREQKLTPPQQLAFAQRFGEPMAYPQLKGLPECPLITPVVKLENERSNFGGVWHSDTTYLERPPMGSMLYALQVPPRGGDTLFANQYLAYETLSAGLKRTLDGLVGVNTSTKAAASKTREDRMRASGEALKVLAGEHPGGAHAPGNRPQGAVRERRPYRALPGVDARGEPAAPGVPFRAPGAARIHLPLPLGAGLARLLGQSLRAAQPGERLPRLSTSDASSDVGRRCAALMRMRRRTN